MWYKYLECLLFLVYILLMVLIYIQYETVNFRLPFLELDSTRPPTHTIVVVDLFLALFFILFSLFLCVKIMMIQSNGNYIPELFNDVMQPYIGIT